MSAPWRTRTSNPLIKSQVGVFAPYADDTPTLEKHGRNDTPTPGRQCADRLLKGDLATSLATPPGAPGGSESCPAPPGSLGRYV